MNQALPEGFLLHGKKPYTVIKPLHSGGFGITYLVEGEVMDGHISLKGRYTIKEFFPSKIGIREADMQVTVAAADRELFNQAKRNFLDEANILHSLNHEAVVPVNEVFEQNNTVYYVMKYLGDTSLYQYLSRRGGFLPEEEAVALIDALADAVKYLHSKDILHLDIKPDNIMMCREDGNLYPVLIDFGQAFFPKSKHVVGGYSEGYSPLELKSPGVTPLPAADIYALAATLCFLLTGQAPEDASTLTKYKIYKMLPEQISDYCAEAVVRALAARPMDRFATVDDFIAALHGRGGEHSRGEGKVTDPVVHPDGFPVKPVLYAALGVVLALLAWQFWPSGKVDPQPDPQPVVQQPEVQQPEVQQPAAVTQPAVQQPVVQQPAIQQPAAVTSSSSSSSASSTSVSSTPTSGTLRLSYGVWKGGIRNGKPHGEGRLTFTREHRVEGCQAVPKAGYYIEGFCENGKITQGNLFDENGQEIEYFIR